MTRAQRNRARRERREALRWEANITAAYASATLADRAAGLAWYDRADRAADRIAAAHGIDRVAAAAIIAALSPRSRWSTNLQAADRIAAANAAGRSRAPRVGLGDARRKAWRIARGADPADVLGGPKVRAFFANITGDRRAVTVDVWATRAAYGRTDCPLPTGRRYDRLADAYRAVADRLGVAPRELQAAVWIHVRGAAE